MSGMINSLLKKIGLNNGKVPVGIAFSGGGAKAFTHIGALMAFEKFEIRPDILSGVSAGSIAAVLYSSGLSPKNMVDCFAEYNKVTNFTKLSPSRAGLFKIDKFARLIETWIPERRLEDLRIPTVVCATNIETGKAVAWSRGELIPRVMASCSIPIIFPPQEINGSFYVDGGVVHNLPAWAIRKSCKTLYGLNCSPLNRNYKYTPSLLDITMRSYSLMSKANALPDIHLCDYVVRMPDNFDIGTFDVKALEKAVTIGYDATCEVLEKSLKNI